MRLSLINAAMASAATLLSATIVIGQQDNTIKLVRPEWESFEEMHDFYTRRFESADGFGLSRMPQPPMLDRSGVLDLGRTRYSIERLELVGLLKRTTPVVYVPLRHSVRFDPKDFRGRRPTDFETRALAALRAGRDIESAAGDEPGTLRIVGALRGDGSCLKCHNDKKAGDLLGAFTYTLRPLPPHSAARTGNASTGRPSETATGRTAWAVRGARAPDTARRRL